MQSTQTGKPNDDPHDVVMVAPDAVRVAPADDEISSLLQQAARHRTDAQTRAVPEPPSGSTIPPVDTTFRPSVNDAPRSGSMARRAARGFIGLLLAVGIGLTAVAWKSYGEVAKKKIAKVATQLIVTSELSSDNAARAEDAAPPAVQADAATSSQAASPAQTATDTTAPADSAQLLQSMARDLANLGQEVQLLKSNMEQLKANQQQATRDVAKAYDKVSDKPSGPNLRPRTSALPPRPAVAQPRKPPPSYPPLQAAASPYPPPQTAVAPYPPSQAAAAPYPPPPATAPYVPRPPEPQPQTASEQRLTDPELSVVPRPPMPVR